LSDDWKANPPREVWRIPVGAGWSSFAVVGEYAVTQEQRGVQECVVCYRVADGGTVWLHTDKARFDSAMGGSGPRATPTVAEGRVYAVGGTGILNCLDGATGNRLWSIDIVNDNSGRVIEHGVCGSPLVADNLVIVAPTGAGSRCLAAYDRDSGERVWQGGAHRASYGSPAIAQLAGVRQVLIVTADGVEGNDLHTGEPLWSYTWTNPDTPVNCSQPIVVDAETGKVLFCSGYGTGSILLEVASSAARGWAVREIWKSPGKMKTKFTTAVLHKGFAYGLDDGILACLDLATGRQVWKKGRYQHGQILLAGERLIVQTEAGSIVLVKPDPEDLIELGSSPALSNKTWNNPALSGRMLLVRNDQEAACYELPGKND
jgi:outer membrane protein assembly factor BamB